MNSVINIQDLRLVTLDVTGTVLKFTGKIGELYAHAAERFGVEVPNADLIHKGFKRAYKETLEEYPHFGGGAMSSKAWWKICVIKSFQYAGCHYDDITNELVFQRVYSL